jgi:signal peptidase II
MNLTPNKRMALAAAIVVVLDQLTKMVVLRYLDYATEKVVMSGFFKFVHWGNTGAAWSMFHNNNDLLAIISLIALAGLVLGRHHFDTGTGLGHVALGLMFGGIFGNLIDRLTIGHVVDFIYFYTFRRGGDELGFPAFNIADSAICTGVGILLLLSFLHERRIADAPPPAAAQPKA